MRFLFLLLSLICLTGCNFFSDDVDDYTLFEESGDHFVRTTLVLTEAEFRTLKEMVDASPEEYEIRACRKGFADCVRRNEENPNSSLPLGIKCQCGEENEKGKVCEYEEENEEVLVTCPTFDSWIDRNKAFYLLANHVIEGEVDQTAKSIELSPEALGYEAEAEENVNNEGGGGEGSPGDEEPVSGEDNPERGQCAERCEYGYRCINGECVDENRDLCVDVTCREDYECNPETGRCEEALYREDTSDLGGGGGTKRGGSRSASKEENTGTSQKGKKKGGFCSLNRESVFNSFEAALGIPVFFFLGILLLFRIFTPSTRDKPE